MAISEAQIAGAEVAIVKATEDRAWLDQVALTAIDARTAPSEYLRALGRLLAAHDSGHTIAERELLEQVQIHFRDAQSERLRLLKMVQVWGY